MNTEPLEEEIAQENIGGKSRGRKLVKKFDNEACTWVEVKNTDVPVPEVKEYAVTFTEYRKENSPGEYHRSTVATSSRGLIRLLKENVEHSRDDMWQKEEVVLKSPYQMLVYSWNKLNARTERPTHSELDHEKEAREDLSLLLCYVRNSQELKDYFESRESDYHRGITSFKNLWTIFAPSTTVVAAPFMGIQQLFEVSQITKILASSYKDVKDYWLITCSIIDFDGAFCRKEYQFKIEQFDDTRSITSLECFPSKFLDNEAEFFEQCEKRGRDFKKYCFGLKGAQKLFTYSGDALSSGVGLVGSKATVLQQQVGNWHLLC